MTTQDILDGLKQLSTADLLLVIEAAARRVREEFHAAFSSPLTENHQLAAAAKALLSEYTTDSELTAFTALDGEAFLHAPG